MGKGTHSRAGDAPLGTTGRPPSLGNTPLRATPHSEQYDQPPRERLRARERHRRPSGAGTIHSHASPVSIIELCGEALRQASITYVCESKQVPPALLPVLLPSRSNARLGCPPPPRQNSGARTCCPDRVGPLARSAASRRGGTAGRSGARRGLVSRAVAALRRYDGRSETSPVHGRPGRHCANASDGVSGILPPARLSLV
jgi:hypothetical protein